MLLLLLFSDKISDKPSKWEWEPEKSYAHWHALIFVSTVFIHFFWLFLLHQFFTIDFKCWNLIDILAWLQFRAEASRYFPVGDISP